VTRSLPAALAALILAAGVAPAFAQYYGDDEYRPRRRYEERYEVERPRYGRPDPYRPRFGRMCVTARGDCPTRPGPINSVCGCEVPGFGFKRGAIGY
jgi:hypothetical protein